MYKKKIKIIVFVLALCTGFTGFAQMKGVVEDSVGAKHQGIKVCFGSLDKKFKQKFKEQRVQATDFKRVANQSQFLIERKKMSKILGKGKHSLGDTYNKLVEMSKKNKIEMDIDYIITGTPSLVRAKNKRYCTYKTTAALKVEVNDSYQTSITKNELTLIWAVEMNDAKGKIKSTKLTSLKAKNVSGFFEYEKQQMQEIAENLIERYYQNLLLEEWDIVLTPEIPNKTEIENHLKNSDKIDVSGDIRVVLPNSQTIIVGEESVPKVNLYDVTEKEQTFALTFNIKINDNFTNGEITKVEYRQLDASEPTAVVPEPQKEIPLPPPEIKEVGMTYKVQILALYEPIKLSDLPKEYSSVENVVMEESVIDGRTYYQYVIPVGNNAKEAQALKNNLIKEGIKSAWVVKYRDGKRIYPNKMK